MKTINNPNRIIFLDNIRSLIIILVLIFHSGASYGTGVEFCPFHDNNPNSFINFFYVSLWCISYGNNVFFREIFCSAGFAKKGLRGFTKSKLKRLGFPWFVITVTVFPVLDYTHCFVHNAKQSLDSIILMEYWLLCMKKNRRVLCRVDRYVDVLLYDW
jgi:peptidoglycan/LPS O-acetylase OafA/YrhL